MALVLAKHFDLRDFSTTFIISYLKISNHAKVSKRNIKKLDLFWPIMARAKPRIRKNVLHSDRRSVQRLFISKSQSLNSGPTTNNTYMFEVPLSLSKEYKAQFV